MARENIRYRVRLGLNYLMFDATIKKNFEEAYRLGKLLADFDKSHYDHFLILARICFKLDKIDEAIDNYNIAIDICKRDRNWNKLKRSEDSTIEEIIKSIEKELSKLKLNK
jgi:Tfp pilus assembly protein PilF